jgi:hypothetical protein
MKTLNRNITSEFFDSADDFAALERRWREIMNDGDLRKTLQCRHHLLYQMLRGKNWHAGLTMVTNAKKLANGAAVSWIGRLAVRSVKQDSVDTLLAPFAGTVTDNAVIQLRDRLPECRWNENPLDKEPYLD